jgi:hypothetical protein
MENDYERLSEILREAIEVTRSEAIYISNQYSILRLINIDEAIVDKVDEALIKSPEKLKALTELIIPKLEKLLKLTGPNKVDNEILGLIADHIRYDIQFDDPNYINTIQKLGKSLDLLLTIHYVLQSTYLGIVYGKFTPPGFYSYFNKLYEDIRNNLFPDRDHIEFYLNPKESYLREKVALSCVKNTVDDLFENPEKHKQLIEEGEGKYINVILNEFCKKY